MGGGVYRAVIDADGTLVCLCVYKCGAEEGCTTADRLVNASPSFLPRERGACFMPRYLLARHRWRRRALRRGWRQERSVVNQEVSAVHIRHNWGMMGVWGQRVFWYNSPQRSWLINGGHIYGKRHNTICLYR